MTEHYYSPNPLVKHDLATIRVKLRGIELQFVTDAGVFSKNRIDRGTELLIKSLPLDLGTESILDLGCGYGPIGLTLAKLMPEATVYLVDINERAASLAQENVKLNQVTNAIVKVGAGFEPVGGVSFDLVVTNPPIRAGKQVIYELVDQAYQALKTGGWLVAVILTRHGAKSLEKKFEGVFGNVAEWEKGSGYRVVAAQKE